MDIVDPKVHYKPKKIVIAEKQKKIKLEPSPIIKQTTITNRIETKIDIKNNSIKIRNNKIDLKIQDGEIKK